ncbi:MAG: hypothetical protein M0Q26_05865 [Chitinophagaceae bacterium]|nr:hypothetical protein [Chitinophagaceae bacterium]MDP1763409.1 hypothetical protein [Sediminibacterium sp.]
MATERLRYNTENRDAIVLFLENGGDLEMAKLNDIQLKLLDRWRFADEKLRENKYSREKVADFIRGKYQISRDTAFRDIVNAEYVFSSTTPLNKKYAIGRRIEFLERKINEAYIDNDRLGAALLEKILQKYYEKYPDEHAPRSPKKIVYNIIQNNKTLVVNGSEDEVFSVDDAMIEADDILKKLEDKDDY